jgi:hypothetical protein
MAKKTFRLGMELLERRETPGAVAAAAVHHIYSVKGSGTGAVTGVRTGTNVANLTATVSGTDSMFGAFTSSQVSGQAKTSGAASGTAVLVSTGNHTNTIGLRFTGKVHYDPHSTNLIDGQFQFTVTGGTGLASGATGQGLINGVLNITTGTFTFTYTGKVRV